MIRQEDTYKIGRIGKVHGLKGEVTMYIDDDIFDRTDCPYLICCIDGILIPFFIQEYRFKSDTAVLIKFDDIDTIEDAERLVGSDVYFENRYIDTEHTEEVSLHYFVGFTIKDAHYGTIGTISDIDDQTTNWLFIVNDRNDGKELLIPAHEELITRINYKKKIIEIDLPEGLLDL